ncbi:MAG: glycosyltransferase family 4 protein, partial [Candidatus Omnitrophota bacterium]
NYLYYGLHCFLKNYDFVHIHHIDGAFSLPLLRLKYPVITTSHGRPYMVEKWNRLVKSYFKLMERIAMRFSNIVVSVAFPLKDYYENEYKRRVVYIPNGVEEEGVDIKSAKEILDKLGLSAEYIFFTSSRIMPTKGVDLLIKAAAKTKTKINVLIIGRLHEVPDYYKYLKQNSADNIFFHQAVNNRRVLMGLMKIAKFFVFPSYEEAMSMVLLEVASLGVPIICSDIPVNRYFLKEGVAYFNYDDFLDLAEKIDYVLNNYQEARRKAACLQEVIVKDYNWDGVADKYFDIYKTINMRKC